ncbi:hypothetical protein Tco_0200691 [Tanacetum coccineum]
MDASDLARAEVMSLRTQVVAQHAVITELQVADRRRQAVITEMLAADRRRQKQFIEALKLLKRLQTQMTEFERQQDQLKVLHSQMHQRRLVAVPRSLPPPAHNSAATQFDGVTDTVMSDSKDSTVTYTAVSSPFADLPDIGSLGVNGPPVMPEDPYAYVVATFQAPASPDYVTGPEYLPLPEFVLVPVYPEFMPPEDDILPAKEQPLLAAVSPTADSPGYVPESDPEEDPEEDDDEDPKEDPADYLADGGDDGDDKDESSDDDEDEEVDIKGDEEEEEHPAPADSTAVALLAIDQALSTEETEPFETDKSAATPPPHPAYRVIARISIRPQSSISLPPREEVERLLAMPTPLSSPLSPWSSPLPQIPSPPLLVSSPVLVLSPSPPASPICPLGYRAAMIRLRAEATSTFQSLPLPPPIILSHTRPDAPSSGTTPLHLLSTDRRADRPEDEMLVDMPGAPATDNIEMGRWMTEFTTRVRQDTDEIYTRLDVEQSDGYVITYSSSSTTGSDYKATGRRPQETSGDYKDAGGRPQETEAVHRGTEAAKETSNSDDRKMAPKRAKRSNIALETTNTTSVTNAQLKAMIDQGVTAALAARDADRNTNDDDSHISGAVVRRTERTACECTFTDFIKCQPLNFKGTERVAGLS